MEHYDWRQYNRSHRKGTVEVSISVIECGAIKIVRIRAELVDVSKGGIGIIADSPLEQGCIRVGRGAASRTGTVMWSRQLSRNRYRIGIRFDHLLSSTGFSLCPFRETEDREMTVSNVIHNSREFLFYE